MRPPQAAPPGAALRRRSGVPPLRAPLWALARGVLLLGAVSVVVFAATSLLPGDAAELRASPGATEEQIRALREELGQDAEPWRLYLSWVGGLLGGDPGTSLVNGRPVADAVAQRLPATATLVGGSLLLAAPAMLLLGGWAGSARRGRAVPTALLTGGAAVPTVVVAAGLAALLSGALGWVPAVSLLPPGRPPVQSPELLVLPVLSMALPTALFGGGLLAGAVADVVGRPHVADARRRGRPPWAVAAVDVLPFLMAPFARVLAVAAGGLIAAATVVETLFGYPGLGSLLVSSIASRDVPVVQTVALLAAAVVLAGLALADAVAGGTDPRRRTW
ncbi:ABC transporter permease [Nocardiopsis lambiniae]|uniref:ABC transporter permease n=1 Tax=Nocardiopsis lambiniae TaxID=3075539 RepID=A0ABU2MET6_9ACTN|nr:ABC transporter permease [Nocardiopsis sp. DSM 44743]MDT0331201.1 ABC transporter permease [Nocardiopsis sp. DSM 44743]